MTANSRKSCRYRDTTEPRRDSPTDGHAVTTRQHTHTSRHTSAWKACGRNDCSRQPSPAAVQSPAGEAKTTTRKKMLVTQTGRSPLDGTVCRLYARPEPSVTRYGFVFCLGTMVMNWSSRDCFGPAKQQVTPR